MDNLQQYSVSLVYQAHKGEVMTAALRSSIRLARSKDEALGMLINELKDDNELKGLSLVMSCVLEVPTNTTER